MAISLISPPPSGLQPEITANGILKGDGNGNIAAAEVGVDYVQRGIFYAIYNETTFAELKAAYDAGMSCACKKDGVIYSLAALDASRCTFSTSRQPNELSGSTEWHFLRLVVIADIYCQKEDDGTTTWRTNNQIDLPDVESLEDALDKIDDTINRDRVYAGDGIETNPMADGTQFHVRFSRQNLLVNWDFGNPVNQRGKTSYAGTGYGVDMWYTTGATLSVDVTAEGVKLYKNAASANPAWAQALETDAAVGQTVTVSMLYKGNGEGASLRVAQSGGIVTLANVSDWTLVQKTFALEKWSVGALQNRAIVAIQCFESMAANQGLYIKAIKLELGEQQTLAHLENRAWVLNEIPSYAEQVSRCQRYLIPLSSYQCPASILGTNEILFFVPLPVTMRDLPTIKQNGFQVLNKNGAAQTGFTFSVSSLRSNGVIIRAAKTGHKMTDAVLSAGTLSLLSAEL